MKLFASVILAISLTGCGTFAMQYHYRLYSGPHLPAEKVAVLKGSFPLVLLRVDEKPGKNNISTALSTQFKAYNTFGNFSGSPGNFRIELLPGKHKLECGYGREAFVNAKLASTMRVFDFEAEAGKTYEVRATPSIASKDIDGYAVEVVTYGDRQSEGTRVSCSTPEIKPIPFLVGGRPGTNKAWVDLPMTLNSSPLVAPLPEGTVDTSSMGIPLPAGHFWREVPSISVQQKTIPSGNLVRLVPMKDELLVSPGGNSPRSTPVLFDATLLAGSADIIYTTAVVFYANKGAQQIVTMVSPMSVETWLRTEPKRQISITAPKGDSFAKLSGIGRVYFFLVDRNSLTFLHGDGNCISNIIEMVVLFD